MADTTAFLWASLGVLVAIVFPVLSGFVRKEFPTTQAIGLPPWVKKYGILLLSSLVTGLIVLAIWKSQHPTGQLDWFTAFLFGFGWESAIEKFQKK